MDVYLRLAIALCSYGQRPQPLGRSQNAQHTHEHYSEPRKSYAPELLSFGYFYL